MRKALNSKKTLSYLLGLVIILSGLIYNQGIIVSPKNTKLNISAEPEIPSFTQIPPQDNAILLQAEDYDDCHDTTLGNFDPLAGFYRQDEGEDADISQNFYYDKNSENYTIAPSYKVSNIESGEWLEWDVDFTVSDIYKFIIRYTGEYDSILHIEIIDINEITMINNIDAPATGNKETWWQDKETIPRYISSREKRVRIVFDDVVNGTLAFDYLYIVSITNPPQVPLSDSDFIVDFGPTPVAPPDYVAPVSIYGNLHVEGNKIVGENGQPIQFRGFASHGPQWLPWIPDYTALNLAYNWDANIVRLTTYISEGVAWENTEMRPVIDHITEEIVKDCIEAGIYVIIGFHQHANTSDLLNYVDEAEDFFRHYVPLFGDYSNVIFEVLNEPVGEVDGNPGVDWPTAKNYAEQVIPIIRDNDPDEHKNLIFVGTPTWCQEPNKAINNPVEGENIIYTFHIYATAHDINLQNNIDYALSKGFAIIADEWSPGHWNWEENPDVNWDYANQWIDFWEARGIGWIDWSFNIKNEPLSTLNPNQYLIAGFWKDDQYLTEIGEFIRDKIAAPYNTWCYSDDLNLGYTSQQNGNYIATAEVLAKDENGDILKNSEVVMEWSGAFKGVTKTSTDDFGIAVFNTPELPQNGHIVTNGYFSNGDFSDDLSNWVNSKYWGVSICDFTVVNGEMFVEITDGGTDDWNVQLKQGGLAIETDIEYTISFDARAEATRDVDVSVGEEGGNYADYGVNTFSLSTEMTHYEFTFVMNENTDLDARLQFNMGEDTNDVYIDNVNLEGIHTTLTSDELICKINNIIKVGYRQDPSNINAENIDTIELSPITTLKGDVNADGYIDIVDALLTAQYYVGYNVIIDLEAADVNADGLIDIIDALLIAQYYVGIISEFP